MSDLRCHGVFRDGEQTLAFVFTRKPTDDELRFIHDCVCRAARLVDVDSPPKPGLRLVPKEGAADGV